MATVAQPGRCQSSTRIPNVTTRASTGSTPSRPRRSNFHASSARGFRRLRWRRLVDEVAEREHELAGLDDEGLLRVAAQVRAELRRGGLRDPAVVRSFALIREVSRRKIGLRHHDVQILGALAMLEGCVAEMDTGEGKTITAALAAATAAFAGVARPRGDRQRLPRGARRERACSGLSRARLERRHHRARAKAGGATGGLRL